MKIHGDEPFEFSLDLNAEDMSTQLRSLEHITYANRLFSRSIIPEGSVLENSEDWQNRAKALLLEVFESSDFSTKEMHKKITRGIQIQSIIIDLINKHNNVQENPSKEVYAITHAFKNSINLIKLYRGLIHKGESYEAKAFEAMVTTGIRASRMFMMLINFQERGSSSKQSFSLKNLVATFSLNKDTRLIINGSIPETKSDLGKPTELLIHLALEEILTNAFKHSKKPGSSVYLEIAADKTNIRLSVLNSEDPIKDWNMALNGSLPKRSSDPANSQFGLAFFLNEVRDGLNGSITLDENNNGRVKISLTLPRSLFLENREA